MRYVVALLAACLFFSFTAYGQATDFQRKAWTWSDTLFGTTADSVEIPLPNNRGKGLLMGYIWADSLGSVTVFDSLNLRYRQGWAVRDTAGLAAGTGPAGWEAAWTEAACQNSSGSAQAWSYVQIYNGVAGSLANFDSTLSFVPQNRADDPGGKIPIVFDLDGYPWRYIQLWIDRTSAHADESLKVNIELDVD